MQDWHTTDIEVRVRENHDDPDLVGQNGIIRSVSVSKNILLTVWTVSSTILICQYVFVVFQIFFTGVNYLLKVVPVDQSDCPLSGSKS